MERRKPYKLDEASLARAYQHVVEKKVPSWGMLTGYRYANNKKENIQANKRLEADLRGKGYGFFKVEGHWQECQDTSLNYVECPKDKLQDSIEVSLFVPHMSKEDATNLCKKYEQDAVIYGGPETKGNAHLIFKNGSEDNIGVFQPGKVEQAYSKFKGGKTFVFGKEKKKEVEPKKEPMNTTPNSKLVANLPKDIANKTVKNPQTGRDIKVTSALKYDDKSPVYKAATSLVAMMNKK
jgi:hypothetical protein